MQRDPLLHQAVMTHVLVAGCLFSAPIVSIDPAPHRASFALGADVLVLMVGDAGLEPTTSSV